MVKPPAACAAQLPTRARIRGIKNEKRNHAPKRRGRAERGRELAWQPRYDDLDQIVADALSWERILAARNS